MRSYSQRCAPYFQFISTGNLESDGIGKIVFRSHQLFLNWKGKTDANMLHYCDQVKLPANMADQIRVTADEINCLVNAFLIDSGKIFCLRHLSRR